MIVTPGPAGTPLDTTAPVFVLGGKKTQKAGKTVSVVVGATTENLYASASGTCRPRCVRRGVQGLQAEGDHEPLRRQRHQGHAQAQGAEGGPEGDQASATRRKKVKASIKLTARDGAGNLTTGKRTVKLKR